VAIGRTIRRGRHRLDQTRDLSDLAAAYDKFGAAVWFTALRITGEAGATAVTKEVFVMLGREPRRHDGRLPLGRWLMDAAGERATSWAKQHGSVADLPHAPGSLSTLSNDDAVRAALGELQLQEAIALALARCGMSVEAAAAELAVDLAQVHSQMRSGLQTIAGALARADLGPVRTA
jgi:DNA-directed RNA polymerase specialized sigma24 family protein